MEHQEEESTNTELDLIAEIDKLKQRIQELEAKQAKRIEPTAECEICHRVFKNKYILKTHMFNVHNENRQRFTCPHCSKTFASKYYLAKHIKDKHTTVTTEEEEQQ